MQHSTPRRRPSHPQRPCTHPGCEERTYRGKPFCRTHCTLNPYAKVVAERLASREAAFSQR
ncbi:MAG: hypothetical protein R3F62_26365 [Planctomycetota bacterium]